MGFHAKNSSFSGKSIPPPSSAELSLPASRALCPRPPLLGPDALPLPQLPLPLKPLGSLPHVSTSMCPQGMGMRS